MLVDSNFDSGNIRVLSIEENNIDLEIEPDPYPKHTKFKSNYWFYFKVSGIRGKRITYNIKNIRNYENCWRGFNVGISYNNKDWKRHSTRLVGNRLTWALKTSKNVVWFAYYVPYPFSRTEKLFKGSEIIGYTLKRNPIYMKTYGSGDKYIWLIARQHPGETIGSWILEGFMKNMKKLGKKYTIKIIGNANPDGTIMGHWRLNAEGVNLNADWNKLKSREIRTIKKVLNREEQGWDLLFDLHGDEGSMKHFVVKDERSGWIEDQVFKIFKDTKYFQNKNSSKEYLKVPSGALGDDLGFVWVYPVCIEGAMKHKLGAFKTLQDQALKVGEILANGMLQF